MRFFKEGQRKRRGNREDVILFAVGPHTFAIGAKAVERSSDMEELRPIKFSHHAAPASESKHTLDANGHTSWWTRARTCSCCPLCFASADVVPVLGCRCGRHHRPHRRDIGHMHPLPHVFLGEERGWYRGVALRSRTYRGSCGECGSVPFTASDIKQLQAAFRGCRRRPRQGGVGMTTVSLEKPKDAFVLFPLGKSGLDCREHRHRTSTARQSENAHTTPLLTGVLVGRGHIVPVCDVAQVLIGPEPARSLSATQS